MSIRDIALAAILAATLPFVFKHAFIGILLWTWISIMNPHKLAWGFMFNAPVAAVVGAVTLISLFTTRDRISFPLGAPVVWLSMFIVWMCITTFLAIFPGESLDRLIFILKIFLMVLITGMVLHSKEHMRLFIWVMVISLGFYGVKGGLFTIQTGGSGRVWGPPGGFIGSNNHLALALIMVIPMMNYLRLTTPYSLVKKGLVVMMVLTAISAIGSQSRGALLAIVAMGFLLWLRAPNKFINALVVAFFAAAVFAFMPQSWHDRMSTIQTYEQDGSAMGRIFAWQTAINAANDRVTGAGFEMYNSTVRLMYGPMTDGPFDATKIATAHSNYFQMLGEHGYVGLFLFLMIFISAWRVAGKLRRGTKGNPETEWLFHLGGMSQVALIGYATGGAFLNLGYFDFAYNIVMLQVLATRWRQEQTVAPELQRALSHSAKPGIGNRLLLWVRTA